jgi:glutathione peroxidase
MQANDTIKIETIYDISYTDPAGKTHVLSAYKDYVMLIVNTATWCWLHAQLKELASLYQTYKDHKFVIIGCPSNQFANQEPTTDEQMVQTCALNYWVTFPLTQKLLVNGPDTHPLFAYLKAHAKSRIFWPAIKRNFTKFLIDRTGRIYKRYAPTTTPLSMENDIIKLLNTV